MMDLYIETLTGTSFELRVSPYETVQDVKARIQKLEGIPISQQHLIWKSNELNDDYCLRDYGICDGTSLRLVLTMRGGPINTRRIPIEDPTLRDISDYITEVSDNSHAVNHDTAAALASELLAAERRNNSNGKPVTLIVYQNGDLLTFYRIDSDSNSPSDSLSGTYASGETEEEPEIRISEDKAEDNEKTHEKMKKLKEKLRNYLPQKAKLTEVLRPPTLKKSSTKSTLCHSPTSSMLYPLGDLQPTSPILPRANSSSATSRLRHITTTSASRSKPTRLSPIAITAGSTGSASAISPPADDLLETYETDDLLTSPAASAVTRLKSPNQYAVQRQTSDPTDTASASETLESILRCSRRRWDLLPLTESKPISKDMQPHSLLVNKPSSLRRLLSNDNLINQSNDSACKPPIFPINKMTTTSNKKPILHRDIDTTFSRHTSVLSGLIRGTHKYSTDTKLMKLPTKSQRLPPVLTTNIAAPSGMIASNSPGKRSKSKRCYLCTKKTGLATSYLCRCGNNYCSMHRYAESHACTYNYKLEGRKLLEQANPVVTAPKLPKI